MKFYVINLDRSPDRMRWIEDQAAAQSLTVIRVAAIDGKTLDSETLNRWKAVSSDKFGIGPGEIACFLSHREAWKKVANDSENWGFISEDDIHLETDANEFISGEAWIPGSADIVKAETVMQRVWLGKQSKSLGKGYRLSELRSNHGGAAGYFLSRDAARRLIDQTENFCSIPDQVLFNPILGIAQTLRIYQLDPAICVQDWILPDARSRKGLGSDLLREREIFHGTRHGKTSSKIAFIHHKLTSPLSKLARHSLYRIANLLGTHEVKKIRYAGIKPAL